MKSEVARLFVYKLNVTRTKFYGPNEPKHDPIKALNLYREPKGDQR